MTRKTPGLDRILSVIDICADRVWAAISPILTTLNAPKAERIPVRVERSRRVNGLHVKENANRRHARGRNPRCGGRWE